MNRSVLALAVAIAVVGCTKIESGEVGLIKSFNGTVNPTPVGVGFTQSLTQTVLVFSAKENIFAIKDLHPQTRDKLTMEDVDMSYAYSVNSPDIFYLYTKYGSSAHGVANGEIYPMATFVESLLKSAVNDVIAKYDALTVNDNRSQIASEIMSDVRTKLLVEKLDGKVNLTQIILTRTDIPKSVSSSATNVVNQQNNLKAKQIDLENTRIEAQRIQALALQADDRYIRYLNAQAMLKMAEHAPSYVIIPMDFGKGGFASLPAIK